MIIRSRRKNDSLVKRVFSRTQPSQQSDFATIYGPEAFLLELAKETARSNRRHRQREFGLVLIQIDDSTSSPELLEAVVVDLKKRLRIYDIIGWFKEQLGVLLPETDRDGACSVANEICDIGKSHNLVFETEVLVYPWDDELQSAADVLQDGFEDGSHDESGSRPGVDEFAEDMPAQKSPGLDSTSMKFSLDDRLSSMIGFADSLPTPWWKRTVDIVGSVTGLLVLSPVFVAAAIAIKLNSKGPIFFKQLREGKDGRHFGIWKFRTMRIDAEGLQDELRHRSEQNGPAFKIKDDPRLTSVGRYLRKSCIDELPQLINILWGDMSLVGPRPLPVHESTGCQLWQRLRLRVLPGLTCIWQVEGGREIEFDDWMRMDMEYIRRRSFVYDFKLILRTAIIALTHRGSV